MNSSDTEFEEALERSSLGAEGARRLRRQTPPSEVDRVRRLARLRNTIVSGRGDAPTCIELIGLYAELGYEADLIPVWRLLTRDRNRFPYVQEVVNQLPIDLVTRLLDVTERIECERLLAGMDDDRLAETLLGVQEKHAQAIVRRASVENSGRFLEALLRHTRDGNAAWLAVASPTMAAQALHRVHGPDEWIVGTVMKDLGLAHIQAILEEPGDHQSRLGYLKYMRSPRKVSQLPYALCLELLFVSYPNDPPGYRRRYHEVEDPVTIALANGVARGICRMSVTEAWAELQRISRTKPQIADYVRDAMSLMFRKLY